jgi:hypothetical protein
MTLAQFFTEIANALAAFLPDWQIVVLAAVVIFAATRVLRGLRILGR